MRHGFAASARGHGSPARVLAAVLGMVIGVCVLPGNQPSAHAAARQTFFVSADGGATECKSAAPCSLAFVRAKLRDTKLRDGGEITGNIDVVLKAGSYDITSQGMGGTTAEGLVFGSADSGKAGSAIRYVGETYWRSEQGATGAAVGPSILTGKQGVTGWQRVDGASNIWSADLPPGSELRDLYVNGRRATRARLVLNPQRPGWASLPAGAGFDKATNRYTGLKLPQGLDPARADEIEAVFTGIWEIVRCRLSAIDPQAGTATVNAQCMAQAANNSAVKMGGVGLNWLENALAFLDEPGQWYFDRQNHKLYYSPRPGEDMAAADVFYPKAAGLIALHEAANLTFQGLVFSESGWPGFRGKDGRPFPGYAPRGAGDMGQPIGSAVTVTGGSGIVIANNTFTRLGGSGVGVGGAARNVTITGNQFFDIAAAAVQVGDVSRPNECINPTASKTGPAGLFDTTSLPDNVDIKITRNVIDDVAVEYLDLPGIVIYCAKHAVISQNKIDNLPYGGISAGRGLSDRRFATQEGPFTITGNVITRTMQRIVDGGAIYVLGSGNNSVIAGNRIRQTGPLPEFSCAQIRASMNWAQPYDPWYGLYLDSGVDRYAIDGNQVSHMVCRGPWMKIVADHSLIRVGQSRDNVVDKDTTLVFKNRQLPDNGTVVKHPLVRSGPGSMP